MDFEIQANLDQKKVNHPLPQDEKLNLYSMRPSKLGPSLADTSHTLFLSSRATLGLLS